jgi:hypothetical protein
MIRKRCKRSCSRKVKDMEFKVRRYRKYRVKKCCGDFIKYKKYSSKCKKSNGCAQKYGSYNKCGSCKYGNKYW